MNKEQLNEFLNEEKNIPLTLEEKIFSQVEQLISFDKKTARKKFFITQTLGPGMTLLICPQYGIGPFKQFFDPSHLLMPVGMWACAIFCGAVFMGVGSFLSLFMMSDRDRAMMRRDILWFSPILTAIHFFLLMLIPQYFSLSSEHVSMSFLFWWFSAAILSSYSIFKLRPKRIILSETSL